MLEARCPQCGKKAIVDDDMENVKCGHCGYVSTYDEYIETMKGKAVMLFITKPQRGHSISCFDSDSANANTSQGYLLTVSIKTKVN